MMNLIQSLSDNAVAKYYKGVKKIVDIDSIIVVDNAVAKYYKGVKKIVDIDSSDINIDYRLGVQNLL